MKRLILLFSVLFLVITANALTPQALVGKTYEGEAMFDPDGKMAGYASAMDGVFKLYFKSSTKVEFSMRVIPKTDLVASMLAMNGAPPTHLAFTGIYKINQDKLYVYENSEDKRPMELTIVRNGESLIVDSSTTDGFSVILTPTKR